jgi:hypothetical protein
MFLVSALVKMTGDVRTHASRRHDTAVSITTREDRIRLSNDVLHEDALSGKPGLRSFTLHVTHGQWFAFCVPTEKAAREAP